jgi:hypothetical protein
MKNETIRETVEASAPDCIKVVINSCFGGFDLSAEAEAMWREAKNIAPEDGVYLYDIARDDPDLVRIVETLGKKANQSYSDLKIVELPLWVMERGWVIKEYDGWEHVAENHCTWD